MRITHPHPEEPNTHVTNTGHGCEDKIHGDDGDQNIIQRKNLYRKKTQINLSVHIPNYNPKSFGLFEPFNKGCCYSCFHNIPPKHTHNFLASLSTKSTINHHKA